MFEKSNNNIFVCYLKSVGVKFTGWFSDKYYHGHPHKYNLYGISKMLSAYGIPNRGMRIDNKDDLSFLDVPFIAHVANDFALIRKISSDKIYYLWKGKEIENSVTKFKELWSGVVLIAEPNENSIEPDYKNNYLKESYNVTLKSLFILSATILGTLICLSNQISFNPGRLLLLAVNIAGFYVSYLLILKQININSQFADKICSLFKKGDCNDILKSPAAKLWGVIGWSEVGFGYFLSNILIVIFTPSLVTYSVFVNILALPYTLWSVWYQKYRAKQWCPLCLFVQTIIWLIFLTGILFGFVAIPRFLMYETVMVICIYLIPFSAISLLLPAWIEGKSSRRISYELNSFKLNDEVFKALVRKRPHYAVGMSTSRIIFGNAEAKIRITVLTNPHCNPCAMMHGRIDKLLDEAGDKFCVQYVFTSFSEDLDSSGKALIAIYMNNEIDFIRKTFNEWFTEGKADKDAFLARHPQDASGIEVECEYQKHREWVKNNKFTATPTILINGYELPDTYKIENVINFTDIDV